MKLLSVLLKSQSVAIQRLLSQGQRGVYLSNDYAKYLHICGGRPQPDLELPGEDFHTLADQHLEDFIHLTVVAGREHSARAWYWQGSLATRSSTETPLFRFFIYLLWLQRRLSRGGVNFVVVENAALAQAVQQNASAWQRNVSVSRFQSLREEGLGVLKRLRRCLLFLGQTARRKIQLRAFPALRVSESPMVLLRSWYSRGAFDHQGRYRDRNFGDFVEERLERGDSLLILPMIFNVSSWAQEVQQMGEASRTGPLQFLIPEKHSSWRDVWKVVWNQWRWDRLTWKNLAFSDLQFERLFRAVQKAYSFSPEQMSLNLAGSVLKSLSKQQVKCEQVFYTFENNSIEKPFLQACRQYLPAAKTYGFQHSVWYQEQPAMQLVSSERATHPQPDVIWSPAARSAEILRACGFAFSVHERCPNYRFAHVSGYPFVETLGDKLLVILSFNNQEALELVHAVCTWVAQNGVAEVYIKAHPLNHLGPLQALRDQHPEITVHFASGSVAEWIPQARLVVMGGGSVTHFEVLVHGVPLLRLRSACDVFLDPLWDDLEPLCQTRTAGAIDLTLSSWEGLTREQRQRVAEQVKSSYF